MWNVRKRGSKGKAKFFLAVLLFGTNQDGEDLEGAYLGRKADKVYRLVQFKFEHTLSPLLWMRLYLEL